MQDLAHNFKNLIPNSDRVDFDLLPPVIKSILVEFFIPQNDTVPPESLLVNLNLKIAQMLSHQRVKIEGFATARDIPVNYYTIIFMPSGSGKDKPPKMLANTIFKFFKGRFIQDAREYLEWRSEEVSDEAEEKFPSSAKVQKAMYIQEHMPRKLIAEPGDGTMEGFLKLREEFAKANFGAPTIQISEFADFILSESQSRTDLLSVVQDVYDFGDSKAKIIKGDKTTEPVEDVPVNVSFHTATSGILEGKGHEKLIRFLDRGLARRSFVCYPTIRNVYQDVGDVYEYIKIRDQKKKDSMRVLPSLSEYMEKVFDSFKKDKILTLDSEAKMRLDIYEVFNQTRNPDDKYQDDAIVAEVKSRHWKTLKLAGIIAAIEHPDIKKILVSDIDYAIYQAELFGVHFRKFLNTKPITLDKKLYQYFLENIGKEISKGVLRDKQLVPQNQFRTWFTENIVYVAELAEEEGYELIEIEGKKNQTLYKLMKKEKSGPQKIRISVSTDITKNFESKYIDFEEISQIANSNINYSPSKFKDNYRKKDNYIEGNNLIVLDIDSDWSLKDAIEFLEEKKLKAMLTTTKSHQKDKNGIKCDRFRIFLPTKAPFMGDVNQFSDLMKQIHKYFNEIPDAACKDSSRFYYGNPNGAVHIIEGDYLDIEQFEIKKPRVVGGSSIAKRRARIVSIGSGNDLTNMRHWFVQNIAVGNRNNMLRRAYVWFKENLGSSDLAKEEVNLINNSITDPLPDDEIKVICRD